MISEKTGYGQSYIKTGSSAQSQGLTSTNANSDTFSSQVAYSTVKQEKETVTYSTGATVTGYHRWGMASTAHVFGVVGYDKASKSYFETTYTIMDDSLQKFQDYSYKTGAYNDNQSGVIDFCAPDDIIDYVKARMFETDGLVFDLDGNVTAYEGTDSVVVIPEYAVISNRDGTNTVVKVVGLKSDVFAGNKSITGVVLSDYIKSRPDYKHRRTVAKSTMFGIMYGMSGYGLSRNLYINAGIRLSPEECDGYIKGVLSDYPQLAGWQKREARSSPSAA